MMSRRVARSWTGYGPPLLAGWLLASPSAAQQAVVRSYDAPGVEVGQAWLMRRAGRCYALMPRHVALETSVPALLREGSAGLRGEAAEVVDLGDDAALAPMTGSIVRDCGPVVGSIGRNLAPALRGDGLGTLRTVSNDGTIRRRAVTLIDDDGQTHLRVRPTNAVQQIQKGESGSLLFIDERPVGMLLSVSSRDGVGTVLRTDVLLAKVETHLRGASAAESPASGAARGPTDAAAETGAIPPDPWQVIAWSADPIGSDHPASRLTAPGTDGFWAARADRWPVAVELGGPEAVRIVRGLKLVSNAEIDPALLPGRIQVLTAVSTERLAWRVAGSGTLSYADGIATLSFAPVRARRLRIEIYPSAAAADRVGLARVVVLEGGG